MHKLDKWNKLSKFRTAIQHNQVDQTFFDYWIQKYGSALSGAELKEVYYLWYNRKE